MDALRIVGGAPLRGAIAVSGAKNACLPLMAAALLSPERHVLHKVPDLADVRTLCQLLRHLGMAITQAPDQLILDSSNITHQEAPYDLVRTMRASVLVLGPLLARFGRAKVSLPGGCAIGARPIDQHLKGMEQLGAQIYIEHGYVFAQAPNGLTGANLVLDMPTVTGTENLMLAASLAKGTTTITNAAQEPEIVDLAIALRQMGVPITGAGTDCITIVGQSQLRPYDHQVVADRIECGTYLVAGALLGEDLHITDCVPTHQRALLDKLQHIGATISQTEHSITISKAKRPAAVSIHTAPYPGFPTDMQAQMLTLLAVAQGTSIVSESIFENRFMHVAELNRLGAAIRVEGNRAIATGVPHLSGTTVMATDLRASACLVLAGLIAQGQTIVRRIYHLDRGYEQLEQKLAAVGANIHRFAENDGPPESKE